LRARTCRIRQASCFLVAWLAGIASAQELPTPPPLPPASVPRRPAPATIPNREGDLEKKLHEMERANRELAERLDAAQARHEQQMKALLEQFSNLNKRMESRETASGGDSAGLGGGGASVSRGPGGGGGAMPGSGAPTSSGPGAGSTTDRGAEGVSGRADGARAAAGAGGTLSAERNAAGEGAEGTGGRTSPEEVPDRKPGALAGKVNFSEGLIISSENDEFRLIFHNLTQAEFRGFPTGDQGRLRSQFFVPRQRWYFSGRATKLIDFYTSINRGYGSLDLLDAFITFNFDTRLRLRVGRTKTPFLYEYYQIAEGDLIAPERSLYAGNLSSNRQVGAMFLGELFDARLDYALGVFNGPRRSFQDFNSDKDLFAFVNARPFLEGDAEALKYLNLGGSVSGGYQDNIPQPATFRTANDQTPIAAADSLSPTFLQFNKNVTELGERTQWAGHLAWYYKSFNLLAEYAGGDQHYSTDGRTSTRVPATGWMVQPSVFLTGERITRRVGVVKPLHDFGYRDGRFWPGAIEAHARYSALDLGRNVFAAGLADADLWANQAASVDVGMNWYLNFYTKIYFDWQHSLFDRAVTTGVPGRSMRTTDLFWLRFQLFF